MYSLQEKSQIDPHIIVVTNINDDERNLRNDYSTRNLINAMRKLMRR